MSGKFSKLLPPWQKLLLVERVKGIEPSSSAWKAVALPLSYTRISEPVIKSAHEVCESPSYKD